MARFTITITDLPGGGGSAAVVMDPPVSTLLERLAGEVRNVGPEGPPAERLEKASQSLTPAEVYAMRAFSAIQSLNRDAMERTAGVIHLPHILRGH